MKQKLRQVIEDGRSKQLPNSSDEKAAMKPTAVGEEELKLASPRRQRASACWADGLGGGSADAADSPSSRIRA